MAVLLALLAAFSYGLGDFVGGLGSKRASPWMVALVSQLAGALSIGILGLFVSGSPSAADLAWAALAGSFVGLGTVFLYRGLASGRMGVVSPVSGVGAALVPVLVGLIAGERPSTLIWLGMLVALPGIWLVSRTPVTAATQTGGSGLLDGVLAGVGFGGMFAAIGQVDEGAGYLPLVLDQFVGGMVVLVVAMTLRIDWVPRLRAGQQPCGAPRGAGRGIGRGLRGVVPRLSACGLPRGGGGADLALPGVHGAVGDDAAGRAGAPVAGGRHVPVPAVHRPGGRRLRRPSRATGGGWLSRGPATG